jgi:hypothetical protein
MRGFGIRGFRIRKSALTFACTLSLFAGLARAQQTDIAFSGSTPFSPKPTNASEAFLPPALNGGVYTGASVQVLNDSRFGLNAEFAARYKQGLYNGYQRYRPVFYDFNAVYAPRLTKKTAADFMAGIGGETLIFYNQFKPCDTNGGSCPGNVNTTHFLLHAGGGVRYYFLHHLFVRPEANYSYVVKNTQFHSGNVVRVGASIGYTFGSN